MQAIRTKYHGPTNNRGSRVTASCERGKLTVSWDPALNPENNHRRAAAMLLAKFAEEDVKQYGETAEAHHWGDFITGETQDGTCVHVLVSRLTGWCALRKAAEKLEALRPKFQSGARDGATLGAISAAMDGIRQALGEVRNGN
jgi:hypothetical protein